MNEQQKAEEIENWYGWLLKRIPELKPTYNKEWIKQALQGYASWYASQKQNGFTKKQLTDFLLKKSNNFDISLYKNAHELADEFFNQLSEPPTKS